MFLVSEESCTLLYSDSGESTIAVPFPELYSSQEEADTRIILHCQYASRQSNSETTVVRSPDTDVFLLLLSFASTIGKAIIFLYWLWQQQETNQCLSHSKDFV